MTEGLNPKQTLFVAEYIVDFNATQAAIRAGYSVRTSGQQGFELLKKHEISEAVAIAVETRAEKVGVGAEYVLSQAVKLHERCMQEVKPKMVKDGPNWVHDTDADGNLLFVFDSKGASSSLKLVGDHIDVSAFRKQIALTGKDGGPVEFSDLTDAQLEQKIKKLTFADE